MTDTTDSGQFSPTTSTCRSCQRMVRLVDIGGALVATDPEVISVVLAGGGKSVHARRVHNERCVEYQAQRKDRREGIATAARGRRSTGL